MTDYYNYPDQEQIFYVCTVVEAICRRTDNTKLDTAEYLGVTGLQHLYDNADIQLYNKYVFGEGEQKHIQRTINDTANEYIAEYRIQRGSYTYSKITETHVPNLKTMGILYADLVAGVADYENTDMITALFHVCHSGICNSIDSYAFMFYRDDVTELLYYYKNGYIGTFAGMSAGDIAKITKLNEHRIKEDELKCSLPLPAGTGKRKDKTKTETKQYSTDYCNFPEQGKIFYVCSVTETICRKTDNTKQTIADYLKQEGLQKLYDAADTEADTKAINSTADKYIVEYKIQQGSFPYAKTAEAADDSSDGEYNDSDDFVYIVPSVHTMSRVYGRLAAGVSEYENISLTEALFRVYQSYICDKIDNYDLLLWYDTPEHLLEHYKNGYISAYAGLSDEETAIIAKIDEWKAARSTGRYIPFPADIKLE